MLMKDEGELEGYILQYKCEYYNNITQVKMSITITIVIRESKEGEGRATAIR